MELVSKALKKCGVKVSTYVSGVPSFGSGVVYETPNYCDYNYVLTARHILQEDSRTEFSRKKISELSIYYDNQGEFKKLERIKKSDLEHRLIIFEEDFAIILINKNPNVSFSQIIVSDRLEDEDQKFFSWATFSANKKELQLFEFNRNDEELKRVKMVDTPSPEALPGISGAGIFINNKNVLYGIICRYPNENFELNTIDCAQLSFKDINIKLKSINRVQLDTETSNYKRKVNNSIIDIHQATINNVCLDLELARIRLQTDIIDDWFHDPLKYIDLLNQDYLFKQFEEYFENNSYEASLAEQFFVPKKKFTLRQALIVPFIDRIMYMAVVGVLAEKLDKAIISNVYSARFNRFLKNQLITNGVEQWKKMQYAIGEVAEKEDDFGEYAYGCVIEIDLLNYFDNISKKLLIEKIQRVCETNNEKEACKLLSKILEKLSTKGLGLPQNSDASALLATFYLNQVDAYMHNSAGAYYRFMDDIRIFCKDRYEARRILQDFEYELRRCHLSVNSQKTKIISILDNDDKPTKKSERHRTVFNQIFNLELNKISRLRKSCNYVYLNQAFHQSIELFKDNISEDVNDSEESAKTLNYALNTIEFLGKKNFNLHSENSDFEDTLLEAIESLKDKPWMTTQVCKVLNLLPSDTISDNHLTKLKEIVLLKRFNTYAFQTYQIWLLLAKHKINSPDLIQYAVDSIQRNDETNRAVIAAMIIYICSVDENYKRVILRKQGENFTHGYFQNRIALISLRAFDSELIDTNSVTSSLKGALKFTNKFKRKDLVYIHGFDNNDDENNLEQLYSI